MNLKQSNSIGQGALFPIRLTARTTPEGTPETATILIDGHPVSMGEKIGWYPVTGTILIKHNLTSLFIYQIGQRFRQENFGSRLWECIEEQNTQLLNTMATEFVRTSIARWESRITKLNVSAVRDGSKLLIRIAFVLDTNAISEAHIEYDNSTQLTYAY